MVKKKKCSISVVKDLIGPKWAACVLCRLLTGEKRFSELQHELPKISHKMLATRLRELEAKDVVHREVINTVPIQTIYSLTVYGESLRELSDVINKWVIENDFAFNPECIYYIKKRQLFKEEMDRIQELLCEHQRSVL